MRESSDRRTVPLADVIEERVSMLEERHSQKKNFKTLAPGVLAVLLVSSFIAYCFYLNTPRRFTQLIPEAKRAESCSVLLRDKSMESTSTVFEGRELEELIGRLDSMAFYPHPEGQRGGGVVVLEGNAEWHFYFRIDGKPAEKSLTITNRGQASVDGRVYKIRTEDLDLLPCPS